MGKAFSVSDVHKALGPAVLRVIGNPRAIFTRPADLGVAGSDAITFAKRTDDETKKLIDRSSASVILCLEGAISESYSGQTAFLIVADPRKSYVTILNQLFARPPMHGIDPTAHVSKEAEIDAAAYIGPGAVVGRCIVGARSIIHANAVLYDGVRVGCNVSVNAGAVIGADGFGYERAADGSMEKFVHFGGVLIEDNVEIGSNTSIDRGTLGDTILRKGVKVDNQVHIAHNVEVRDDAVIIAQSMIGGSVKIGARAWLAPSVTVLNGISIGADAMCGLGAVVTKSVRDGDIVMGNPARPVAEAKALLAAQKKLIGR